MFYCSSHVQFDAFITSENNNGKKVKGYRPTFDIAPLRSESPPQKRSVDLWTRSILCWPVAWQR